jgi:hypothetical protein
LPHNGERVRALATSGKIKSFWHPSIDAGASRDHPDGQRPSTILNVSGSAVSDRGPPNRDYFQKAEAI